jgi:fibronectin type 3 domain-containing protein
VSTIRLSYAKSRLGRRLIGAAVVVSGAAFVPVLAATAATEGQATQTTHLSGFQTSRVDLALGTTLRDDVTVSPKAVRTVVVQARRPGATSFVTQSSGKSAATGVFHAQFHPTTTGAWRFRLVVRAGAGASALTSPARIVNAIDRTPPAPVTSLTASGISDKSATLSWKNPGGDLTGVMIRRNEGNRAPESPFDGTRVADVKKPVAMLTDSTLVASESYTYAVFAHDASRNYARAVTVQVKTTDAPDVTAPGEVSNLTAQTVDQNSIALSWSNPSAPDLAGIIVVRKQGTTAPANRQDGTQVENLPASATSYTDNGLDADTDYSYALFTYDGAPNYSAGQSATARTAPLPTTAVLAVQVMGHNSSMVTVNSAATFDASRSVAAAGKTLVSGSITYGDGQSDTFTDPVGPYDYWNTYHVYTSTGPKTVTLSVTDSDGTTSTTTEDITVYDPPTASITAESSTATVGQPVTFDLSAGSPGGTSVNWYTIVISGPEHSVNNYFTAPDATQQLTFNFPGAYTIEFVARDNAGGGADVSSTVVNVTAP